MLTQYSRGLLIFSIIQTSAKGFLNKYLSSTLTVEQLGSWKGQLEKLRKFNLTEYERQLYGFGRAQEFTEDPLPIGSSIPLQQNSSDFVVSRDFTCISAGELEKRLQSFGVDTLGLVEKNDYISPQRKAHQDHDEGNLRLPGQPSASGDAASSANVPRTKGTIYSGTVRPNV